MKIIKHIILTAFIIYLFYFSDYADITSQLKWMQTQRNMFFVLACYLYIVDNFFRR